ncbi:hypothetical protein [Thiocystis violascens]|uniref:Uncharacterized protein n=1 Tax=Thiocystis violascens (strain ATCC 17096 / DSM 198 / 6111) TaxID=765911 RepID=I3Y536_THIV6|nr:hypothetical protein [Thiocystis violascens]AFL72104.1 hypothetical protein Thivi_0012 [Thiocystis violascens DSM 198]
MRTTTRIALLGGVLIGASCAANAETSHAIALSVEQMDGVTAAGLTFGAPLASSEALSHATGAFVITGSQSKTLTSKSDPAGLPPVLNTYGTVSYGLSMAANGGDQSIPGSSEANVTATNSLPFADVIGGTVHGRYEGANGVIESTASVYIGGAWISMAPAWVKSGL